MSGDYEEKVRQVSALALDLRNKAVEESGEPSLAFTALLVAAADVLCLTHTPQEAWMRIIENGWTALARAAPLLTAEPAGRA